MPRLGHKKSRNGCRQCKARHVKCDENKPCSNCTRHGVLCSLVDPNASPTVPSSSSSAPPARTTKALAQRPKREPSEQPSVAGSQPPEYVLNLSPRTVAPSEGDSPQSGSDTFPFITKFVHKRQESQPDLWLRDLEVMHHWSTQAFLTLSYREDVRHMWSIVAPKQAITYTFLMNEILAFSALHMAYLYPEKRRGYYGLGIHHQDYALRGMRKVLKDITEVNAPAIFATSTLTTLSVFASRGLDAVNPGPSSQPALDDLIDIFALIQGMAGIVSSSHISVLHGPFAPVFRDPSHEIPPQPAFAVLLEQIPNIVMFIEKQTSLDEAREELVNLAGIMRDVLLRSMKPAFDNRELRFLFLWPIYLSPNFFNWLRVRHSGALVLLMHWAVVLYAAEPVYWFMTGWADRVTRGIREAIEPGWREGIEWPLQYIEAFKKARARAQQQELQQQQEEDIGVAV